MRPAAWPTTARATAASIAGSQPIRRRLRCGTDRAPQRVAAALGAPSTAAANASSAREWRDRRLLALRAAQARN